MTTTSPARTRSTRRRRRLLSAARLCLGPGSYHGVRGCPGQPLESRRPPATGASSISACGLCVTVRLGLALRRALLSPYPAARRRPDCRSPCGNRVVVQPAPGVGEQGLSIAQRPLGVSLSLCKRTWPCPLLAPRGFRVPRSLPVIHSCWLLSAPSAQPWHLTSLLDIRGHSRVPSGGGCQAQAPGTSLPPSSIHLSGSRAQSPARPWDQALVQ